MGNTTSFDPQDSAHFGALPNEILILIIERISLRDYIALESSCKYYHYQLFGSNNLFWGYICKNNGGLRYMLKSLQFARRWQAGGNLVPIDVDLTNEDSVRGYDFKKIMFDYYIQVLCKANLATKIKKKAIVKSSWKYDQPTVEILEYSLFTRWSQYKIYPKDLNEKYFKDFFFKVNIECDELDVSKLPYLKAGRLVVYCIKIVGMSDAQTFRQMA